MLRTILLYRLGALDLGCDTVCGCSVQVAALLRWPLCSGGRSAQVAALLRWPLCSGGRSAQVAALLRWLLCSGARLLTQVSL